MGLQGHYKSRNIVQSSIVCLIQHSLDNWRVTLVSSADAAGHLHRGQALPALVLAGLRQAAALLCGVRWRPGSGLWRRHGHAHGGRARGEQPSPAGVTWLDLAVHPQEASRSALLTTPVDKLTQMQRKQSKALKWLFFFGGGFKDGFQMLFVIYLLVWCLIPQTAHTTELFLQAMMDEGS